MDYLAKTKEAFDFVEELINEAEENWEYVTEIGGVAMFKRINEAQSNGIHCIKTCSYFDFTPEEIFNWIWNLDNRKKFDNYLKKYKIIGEVENIEEPITNAEIMYQAFSMPFPITDRDFCLIRASYNDGTRFMTAAKSVVHDEVPEDGSHVRGEIIVDGFVIDPHEEGKSVVTYVAQVDPKGSIPSFAVNLANKKVPQTVIAIKKAMIKDSK
eukprot:TRINITY_DN5691_c0_g1_i1.p1 TRINITY_DN5691_c0_g1~~TRINITY_DN5691_c0_g1_i1.p1  ORF type:complete len:212 (+),score=55.39 TRINITY_DN5691_c0_g1_i1:27-662(+)